VLRLPWGSLFVLQFMIPLKRRRHYIDNVKPFRLYLKWAFWNDTRFFFRMLFRLLYFWFRNRLSRDRIRREEFRLSLTRLADAVTHKSLDDIAEEILKNTSYNLVVFGHSHEHRFRSMGRHGDYFNTGTWTDIISLDVGTLGRKNMRTYLLIEMDENEKPKATLKRWRGLFRLEEDVM
jgi:hypothetical protein